MESRKRKRLSEAEISKRLKTSMDCDLNNVDTTLTQRQSDVFTVLENARQKYERRLMKLRVRQDAKLSDAQWFRQIPKSILFRYAKSDTYCPYETQPLRLAIKKKYPDLRVFRHKVHSDADAHYSAHCSAQQHTHERSFFWLHCTLTWVQEALRKNQALPTETKFGRRGQAMRVVVHAKQVKQSIVVLCLANFLHCLQSDDHKTKKAYGFVWNAPKCKWIHPRTGLVFNFDKYMSQQVRRRCDMLLPTAMHDELFAAPCSDLNRVLLYRELVQKYPDFNTGRLYVEDLLRFALRTRDKAFWFERLMLPGFCLHQTLKSLFGSTFSEVLLECVVLYVLPCPALELTTKVQL